MARLVVPVLISKSGNKALDAKRLETLLAALDKEIDISQAGKVVVAYGGDQEEYHGLVGKVAERLQTEIRLVPGWEKGPDGELYGATTTRVGKALDELEEDIQVLITIVDPGIGYVLQEMSNAQIEDNQDVPELYPGEAFVYTRRVGGGDEVYFI